MIQRIIDASNQLKTFPGAGRIIPEIGDATCREVIVWPYRLMYRIEGDTIWITRIIHGARDWSPGV